MPAWILGALALLRSTLVGTPLRAGITGGALGAAAPGFIGPSDPRGGDAGFFDFLPFVGDGKGGARRRRRRRALTASDRADIAFIAGIISKQAADRFAVALVSGRSR